MDSNGDMPWFRLHLGSESLVNLDTDLFARRIGAIREVLPQDLFLLMCSP